MGTTVCVVGAGPSGLVTVKELSDKNLQVKCFEAANEIGGAFNSTNDNGQAYDSLFLTVSNYFMSFSDFMPEVGEKRQFWTSNEYKDYLNLYVEHNDIQQYIYTGHRITNINLINGKVIVDIISEFSEFTEVFDFLVICTGNNSKPKIPFFKGFDQFKGQVLHSRDYVSPKKFQDKKVLCIGLGESGADIAHQVSQITNCSVLVRDYPNVIPRWIKNYTNDAYTSTYFYSMKSIGISCFMRAKALGYLMFQKKMTETDKLIQKWTLYRKRFLGKFLTKSDVFISDIVNGRLNLIKDSIEHFTESGVITKNGEKITADVIIFNTGYKTDFSSFSFGKEFMNPRALFKNMIHPKYGKIISLIGWARPSQGGLPACSEMQARYLAKLVSGETELPPSKEMLRTIREDRISNEYIFKDSPEVTSLVNYCDYMTSMSKLIGCQPKLLQPNNLRLSKKLLLGSHISAFYRLNDPSKCEKALEIIESLPISYSKRRISVILLFILIFNPLYQMKIMFLNLLPEKF